MSRFRFAVAVASAVVVAVVADPDPCFAQEHRPALYSVYFANENTGWAVGNAGVILSTNDAGKSWMQQESRAAHFQSLYSVHFANETTGWAVGDGGVILSTTDSGTTWTWHHGAGVRKLHSVHFA